MSNKIIDIEKLIDMENKKRLFPISSKGEYIFEKAKKIVFYLVTTIVLVAMIFIYAILLYPIVRYVDESMNIWFHIAFVAFMGFGIASILAYSERSLKTGILAFLLLQISHWCAYFIITTDILTPMWDYISRTSQIFQLASKLLKR